MKTIKTILDEAITELTILEGEPMDGDRTEYIAKVFLSMLNKRQGNV